MSLLTLQFCAIFHVFWEDGAEEDEIWNQKREKHRSFKVAGYGVPVRVGVGWISKCSLSSLNPHPLFVMAKKMVASLADGKKWIYFKYSVRGELYRYVRLLERQTSDSYSS